MIADCRRRKTRASRKAAVIAMEKPRPKKVALCKMVPNMITLTAMAFGMTAMKWSIAAAYGDKVKWNGQCWRSSQPPSWTPSTAPLRAS